MRRPTMLYETSKDKAHTLKSEVSPTVQWRRMFLSTRKTRGALSAHIKDRKCEEKIPNRKPDQSARADL